MYKKHYLISMRYIVWGILMLFYTVPVNAQNDLYKIDVPLVNEEPDQVLAAKQEALKWMLMRLTGEVDIENNANFKRFFNQLSQYTDTIATSTDNTNNSQTLSLGFNKNNLLQDLKGRNNNLWTGKRPTLAAWIILEQDNQTRIMGNQSSIYEDLLLTASHQRAIQLTLPLLDLQDLALVQTDTLSQLSKDALYEASSRYNIDGFIQARISQYNDSSWYLSGRLVIGKNFIVIQAQASDYEGLIANFMNQIMAELFNIYANNTSVVETASTFFGETAKRNVIINVSNIDSLADYAAINQALKELGVIDSMQLLSVQADSLYIKLNYEGNEDVLQSNLSLIKSLKPSSVSQNTIKNTLSIKQFNQDNMLNNTFDDNQADTRLATQFNNLWYYSWQKN